MPIEELVLRTEALLAASYDKLSATADSSAEDTERYFSLVVAGREHVLDIVDVAWDGVFELYHILAAVVNDVPAAYLRLSIDPASGAIAATLDNGAQRYRIISGSDLASQMVFPLSSTRGANPDERLTPDGDAPTEMARLERRHAQAERIAEIEPEYFSAGANGYGMRVAGGDLGTVPIDGITTSIGIARLLKHHSVFTYATGDEEFAIVSVQPEGDGQRIRYRQVISGIPVVTTALIDIGPSGEVRHLSSSLVNPAIAPDPVDFLDRYDAQRRVQEEIAKQFPGYRLLPSDSVSGSTDLKLQLSFRAESQSRTDLTSVLVPIWRSTGVALSGGASVQIVTFEINAMDGKVVIDDARIQ